MDVKVYVFHRACTPEEALRKYQGGSWLWYMSVSFLGFLRLLLVVLQSSVGPMQLLGAVCK